MAADADRAIPDGAALGMVETHGLVAAIEAADAMVKAASVRLIRQQRTVPAMITHFVVGDVGAVQAAVSAAEVAVARIGRVIATHVIARPAPGVWKTMVGIDPDAMLDTPAARPATASAATSKAKSKAKAQPAASAKSKTAAKAKPASADGPDYAERTVRELRTLARDRDDDRLTGRDIASASKAELVAFLRESA